MKDHGEAAIIRASEVSLTSVMTSLDSGGTTLFTICKSVMRKKIWLLALTAETTSAMECTNAYCNNAQVIVVPAE